MQKFRRDVTVGVAVILPLICCLLNVQEGNLCVLIKLNLLKIRKMARK